MLESLKRFESIKKAKDIDLNRDKWLYYLYVTKEHNYSLGKLKSLSELTNKTVLNYTINSLKILNQEQDKYDSKIISYVEETLKWMDVAKCGTKTKRQEWLKKGYDLFVHNIGSSLIYAESNNNKVVEVLIRTHGLIGQYIKGEVNLNNNIDLYQLIKDNLISKEDLREVLILLNKSIIGSISLEIWEKIKETVEVTINKIINNDFIEDDYYNKEYITNRIIKLRSYASLDDKEKINEFLSDERTIKDLGLIFKNLEIWYMDSALYNFSYDEIIKIMILISDFYSKNSNTLHLSFEDVMKEIYIDYNGSRVVNIYKKRIIESYLKSLSVDEIKSKYENNPHIKLVFKKVLNTIIVSFEFSKPAQKLIEFCEIAYGTDSIFNKAVYMLYDLFGFRRDEYDRFYNEIDYLKRMNSSLSQKAVILNYITGNKILDVGPGGGALMDLIADKFKVAKVLGIDISQNVIEELLKRKELENRRWDVVKGDALELEKYFSKGSIDTIIYSSIIHELFSYIPYEGNKFNHKTIKKALKSAYDILPNKGRIIIRDGIMTENKELKRIIRFKNKKDMEILNRYCNDFKGRKVTYEMISDDTVMMLVNDAMEFLYTYTWGENSYSLEVQEQFGYFTPHEYIDIIKEVFNNKCEIVECLHFLQDGYEEHLFAKIEFYDENYIPVSLPDSTCIIVIEKTE